MGDEDPQVNMEPLLPTSPTKKVVKSARFQVAQVGDKSKKGEDDNVTADENGWTHQGSMRSGDTVQFTQYAKSFRHYLTRDALPAESNYRNLLSFGRNSVKGQRPTLEQLREEDLKQNGVSVQCLWYLWCSRLKC